MKHLAMIMDGNRRWAKENGVRELYNESSMESVRTAAEFCIKNEIKYLSLYAFSLENFNRSKQEQTLIFKLLMNTLEKETPRFIKEGMRIRFVGDRTVFPKHVIPHIEKTEEATKDLDSLTINLLFCYGGRQELASAMQAIAKKVKSGELAIGDITDQIIGEHLWTEETPEPELIIRTGGAQRLSNFLTYQSAYSEFSFLDCYWPELKEAHLAHCIKDYNATKRNFGY